MQVVQAYLSVAHRIAVGLALVLVATATLAAPSAQQLCDRLAGDPAVRLENIDAARAVPACEAAMGVAPTASTAHQYARALERAGRLDKATPLYQWAAEDNYGPAVTALARLKVQPIGSNAAQGLNVSAERSDAAAYFEALGSVAARLAETLPRDHEDPLAVLSKVGTEPPAIRAWVASNTRLVPYVGMLRGSAGVLMDRAGNSLDRALLLAELLKRAGQQVRLARATLAPAGAAALQKKFLATAIAAPAAAPPDRAALIKQVDIDPRVDRATIEAAANRAFAAEASFNTAVKSLYGQVFPAVQRALGDDPRRDQQLAADAAAVLADHFWVQRRIATGWEDMDPDADVVTRMAPSATFAPEQVPDALKHKVTIRLVLETWTAGKLAQTRLLERTWLPADLMTVPIRLSHAFLPQSTGDQLLQQASPAASLVDQLGKAWVVQPTLQVGPERVTDRLYTLGGQVLPAGPRTLASLGVSGMANFAKVGAGVNSAFGGHDTYGPPDERTSAVKVVAEWLEIDIVTPGRPTSHQRRAIFDLVPATMRAAGGAGNPPIIDIAAKYKRASALLGTTDFYISPATPAGAWIDRMTAASMSAAGASAAAALRTARNYGDAFAQAPHSRPPPALWYWAYRRSVSPLTLRGAPTSTTVALLWQVPEIDTKAVRPARAQFDIAANGYAADSNFVHRAAQGVLDTVLEHAMFGDTGPGGNTAALHASDIGRNRTWILLDREHSARLQKLALDTDTKTLIGNALASGQLALVPPGQTPTAGGAQAAWWRIDARSGEVLGIGRGGRGSEALEEAVNEALIDSAGCWLGMISSAIYHREMTGESAIYVSLCMLGVAFTFSGATVIGGTLGALDLVIVMFEMWEWGHPHPHPHPPEPDLGPG